MEVVTLISKLRFLSTVFTSKSSKVVQILFNMKCMIINLSCFNYFLPEFKASIDNPIRFTAKPAKSTCYSTNNNAISLSPLATVRPSHDQLIGSRDIEVMFVSWRALAVIRGNARSPGARRIMFTRSHFHLVLGDISSAISSAYSWSRLSNRDRRLDFLPIFCVLIGRWSWMISASCIL